MTTKGTLFGEQAVNQLRSLLRALGLPIDVLRSALTRPTFAPEDYVVVTPPAGIPARSGLIIYSALCHVYQPVLSATGETATLTPVFKPDGTQRQVRCFNLAKYAGVGGSKVCVSAREKWGLRYIAWEECEGGDEYYYG